MNELAASPRPYGSRSRGVSASDVERAADQLLRGGERPTVEKIRATLGTGSPNTINPLLDAWWKRIGKRLDAGPAALHRLPESVAHVAEALWMQALEEGRRRALLELSGDKRAVEREREAFEVRSHVLTLREGELDQRLQSSERVRAVLEAQIHDLTLLLKKEQATRDAQARRMTELTTELEQQRRQITKLLAGASIRQRRNVSSPRRRAKPKRTNTAVRTPSTRAPNRRKARTRRSR